MPHNSRLFIVIPTADQLYLKKGAQVMFVRNDSSAEKMYFDGKIGEIIFIDQHEIRVQCPGEATEITVEKTTWENIKYNLDAKTKAISEQAVGSFYQFPLRLAWAITIHKSQGLTFEHAIIDANAAFSHGQVYVALSRCKTFEGMVLSTPISKGAVKTDHTVAQFTQQVSQNLPTAEQLDRAKITYQQKLLLESFDHQVLHNKLNKLIILLRQNLQVIQFSGLENAEEMARQTSDNKDINKQMLQVINSLSHFLSIKVAILNSCESGFSTHRYLNAIALAEIEFNAQKPVKKPKEDLSNIDVEHAKLLSNLSAWRAKQAEHEDVERYRIIHQSVLIQIANTLPMSKTDLLNIKGVGQHTVDKYATALLEVVATYCNKHNIQSEPVSISKNKVLKIPKINSKQISYELYLEGKTIQQIADLCELVKGTIESHLTHYVGTGDLGIDDFVSAEKMAKIQQALKNKQEESLSWLKEQLGEEISYTDIRMVVEHQKSSVSDE